MGLDVKNLMNDGNVQVVKTGEIIGATQLTEGELIVEAGGRAKNTVVAGADWLKMATGGIAKRTQYGNNGTLSVSGGAIATDIVQPEGGAVNLSMLATVNSRHPEDELSADQGYAYDLLLRDGGNLRISEGHRAEKIILDQEDGLLVSGTALVVVVDEGDKLLVYPGEGASNCKINQDNVSMLAGKVSDMSLADGTMNNLGGEDSDAIVENGSIYRLGTGGLQLYSSDKTQNLSMNVGGRAEMHAGTLENVVIQGGTVILLLPASTDEDFVVEEDRAPAELTGSVTLLDGASMIIGYGADLQQPTITVQQGGVLVFDGSTVKGDSVTLSVGNINLNDGKLWLITSTATHVQLKVKRLHGEGAIYLQTSTKEISPDFINAKGKVTEDIHVEVTDASRQTLYNALKLQPGEDGTDAMLQPT